MIPVQMLREHRYRENDRGDTRVLHHKWVGELPDEAALGVIAIGAARPLVSLNNEHLHAVEVVKAMLAGDAARLAELTGVGDDGSAVTPPSPMGAADLPPGDDTLKIAPATGEPSVQVGQLQDEAQPSIKTRKR